MTLRTRNKIMQMFFYFSLCCIAIAAACFVVALIHKAIIPPPILRLPSFITKIPVLKYSFAATILSIALIICFTPFTIFHSRKLFENTQCSEIIYFLAFLCGCLCESARVLTPLFGLWSTFSNLLFFCGRIIFIGRLLCPLSFVFAAVASSPEQRQDVERNMSILFGICIVFAVSAPINTARITSAGTITWGFPSLFFLARLLFIALAFISFWISYIKQNAKEYKTLAFSMLFVIGGYGLLCISDNYIMTICGLPLLVTGTFKYLKTLHTLYMWK